MKFIALSLVGLLGLATPSFAGPFCGGCSGGGCGFTVRCGGGCYSGKSCYGGSGCSIVGCRPCGQQRVVVQQGNCPECAQHAQQQVVPDVLPSNVIPVNNPPRFVNINGQLFELVPTKPQPAAPATPMAPAPAEKPPAKSVPKA